MNTFGPDSLTAQQYFFNAAPKVLLCNCGFILGRLNIKNTRYALRAMLLVDVICVITFVASWFF
jgi:spore maturation protein SpmB